MAFIRLSLRVAAGHATALAACVGLLALPGCTMAFTPGDAKPAVYTPYPKSGASAPAEGSGMRGGPGTPP